LDLAKAVKNEFSKSVNSHWQISSLQRVDALGVNEAELVSTTCILKNVAFYFDDNTVPYALCYLW